MRKTFRSGVEFSGINYIGNYTDDVNAFISANPVPEPTSMVILASIGAVAFLRRRR